MSPKRCQVVPFTHAWFRCESEDDWCKRCAECGKFVVVESKDWYFPDRTDIPDVIPDKQPPKSWTRLPTHDELEWSRALGVSHVEAKVCLASGITLAEAKAMVASGGLDLDALSALAGLRS